jgi:hypothetical protein
MSLRKITVFYTEYFSVSSSLTLKFRTIAIFESFIKQNKDSHKTYRYAHDLLLCQTSFV